MEIFYSISSLLKRGKAVTPAIQRQCLHKARKEVLVKKRIKVELTLLETLSNTDPEHNSGWI